MTRDTPRQGRRTPIARAGRRTPPRRGRARLGSTSFRLWSAFCVVAIVLTLYAGRLVQLQGIDAADYAAMALAQGSETITLDAPRASIYDRNGAPLAESIAAAQLVADPTYTTKNAVAIATRLHQWLHLDYLSTLALLQKPRTRYVQLARHLDPTVASKVVSQLDAANLPGVYQDKDTQRIYPAGSVGANLVGFVGADGNGLAGFENSLNSQLRGRNGSATFETVDGQQLPLAASTVVQPKDGTGVRLTIDQDLQFLAQQRVAQAVRAYGAKSGAAVIMDVKSGQLLALADYPSFNPNHFAQANPANYGSRAIQDAYEPGSVEKIVTFSSLLNAGYIKPTTKVTVPPELTIGPDTIHDAEPHGTLQLTAAGVLAESSNIGTAISAEKLPAKTFYHYIRAFGLGSRPDLGLGGATAGVVPPPASWKPIRHATIAFGQGISVSAVQMAAAVNTVANHGVYVAPSLIDGYVSPSGHFRPAPPPKRHRVISAHTAHEVTLMMEDVMLNGTGTGLAIKGYNIAGKTGTAQHASNGRYDGTLTLSFVGFAPAANPRFLVYVVVQQPRTGGWGASVAGPSWHDLMLDTLQKYGVPTTTKSPKLPPTTW